MALVKDNDSEYTADASYVSSISWNHTISSATDGVLVIGVGVRNTGAGTESIQSVTFNGTSCTLIRKDEYFNSASKSSALYYIVNPSVGTYSIQATFTGQIYKAIGYGVSYTGANTTSPIGADAGQAGATGNDPSTNITTQNDNSVVVDVCFIRNATNDYCTPGANQTEWVDQNNGGDVLLVGSSESKATAGSVTMSWTNGINDGWSHSLAEINEASAGPAPEIEYVRTAGAAGANFSFDCGTADTDRLITIHIDDERSSLIGITAVTVDGKSCTKLHDIVNTIGAGNAQQFWYITESTLGSSNGSVTVAFTGTWDTGHRAQAMLHTGVEDGAPHDSGYDNTSGGISTITVTGIDCPTNGVVVGGWGQGKSAPGAISSVTSPHTERVIVVPSSATLALTSGLETSGATNKTYVLTWTDADQYRGTGIVASWGPATTPALGWGGKVNTISSIAKIHGIEISNIAKVNTI